MNYLFAFDAFCFSYYLEYQVGDVVNLGLAALNKSSLTFHKNYPKGYAKADFAQKSNDKIYGTLYQLTDEQMDIVKTKLTKRFHLHLQSVVVQGKKRTMALTLRPYNTTTSQSYPPLPWYKELMLKGLIDVGAPQSYLDKIASFPTAELSSYPMGIFDGNILKYPALIKKWLSSAAQVIQELNTTSEFIISAKSHRLNKRKIKIYKETLAFRFETTVIIKKGVQNHQDLIVAVPELKLSDKYRIKGNGFVATSISYGASEKHISGGIHQIESLNLPAEALWRVFIPIDKKADLHDFQSERFLLNGRAFQGLIRLNICGTEIHFLSVTLDEKNYIVIDALSATDLKLFQKISHSVLLIFAILKGRYYSGDAYFIAYDDPEMKDCVGLSYAELSSDIVNMQGIFTTNPFTGIDMRKFKRSKYGLPKKLIKNIEKGMNFFSRQHYSSLCELMVMEEMILRAIIQIVHNQNATLEIKIPVLYVALETITAAFTEKGNKELKPIENNELSEKLVNKLKLTVEEFTKQENFSTEQLAKLQPLINKLNTLNSPPNADKLSKIFPILGYNPTDEDKKVIKERNVFLHGSSLKMKFSEIEYEFKSLYDLSLRLNFLLAVLLLKKVGFSGKILNYNKLHEHITGIIRDEDIFTLI